VHIGATWRIRWIDVSLAAAMRAVAVFTVVTVLFFNCFFAARPAENTDSRVTNQLELSAIPGFWPTRLYVLLLFLFFDDFCQTDYLNIYRTDLHRDW